MRQYIYQLFLGEFYSTQELLSKNRDLLSFGFGVHLVYEFPGLDYSVVSDGAPLTEIVSCLSKF